MNSKQLAGKSPHVELQRQKLQRMMNQVIIAITPFILYVSSLYISLLDISLLDMDISATTEASTDDEPGHHSNQILIYLPF